MNQELKEKLHYYLPHGLKVTILNYRNDCTGIEYSMLNGYYPLGNNAHYTYDGGSTGKTLDEFKPHMRPLCSLTQEITVPHYNDGKPFVPIKVLGWPHWSLTERGLTTALINISGWEMLFQWHFWIGDQSLFDTGEIIKIES